MRTRGDAVVELQQAYAERQSAIRLHGLTVDEAFIRGIRDLGYRSNLHAFAELIDNSVQAYAERIDIVFGYDEDNSMKKPNRIAVVDDGHGMPSNMLRLAMMWGGTHREGNRDGLGRYGYGLPCATVSIGRRFKIISKLERGPALEVVLDLDDLDKGTYRSTDGQIVMPDAKPAEIPDFLLSHLGQCYPDGWNSGTIILMEKLDRVEWTTALGMRTNLLRHLGVTYHKMANLAGLYVDGMQMQPVDPLFLTPTAKYFALDEDRAVALEPVDVTVRNPITDREGIVTLRYAWLPPSFGGVDKSRDAVGLNANARFPFLKDYHGLIFSRNGRLIDVQSRAPWTVFINNDRYIRVEIEFSASLDELFGVTTSKQQVSVSPDVWDALRQAGIHKAIEQLRAKVRQAKLKRSPLSRSAIADPPLTTVEKQSLDAAAAVKRRDLSNPPPLFMMKGEHQLRGNKNHPLFDGSAGAAACGEALQKLVDMIGSRTGCGGAEGQDHYGDLLATWHRWVQSGTPR
ncbi:ATP-binding protein [Neorhizobium sp. BT27B]|uniref:ATP-binding protein n=1 Tax=Neorhizobium sp. BT27B TaxID=3142625 RepID=UPI003D2A166B